MAKNNRKNEMFAKFAHVANKNINKNQPSNPQNKETNKMENKQFNHPTTFAEFNAIIAALKEKAVNDNKAALLHVFGNGVMASITHVIGMIPEQEEREKMLASEELFSKFINSTHADENAKNMLNDMVVYLNGGSTMLDAADVDVQLVAELSQAVNAEIESSKEGVAVAFAAAFPNGVPTSASDDSDEGGEDEPKPLQEQVKDGVENAIAVVLKDEDSEDDKVTKIIKKCIKAGISIDEPINKPKTINDIIAAVKVLYNKEPKEKSAEFRLMAFWGDVVNDLANSMAAKNMSTEESNKVLGSKKAFKALVEPFPPALLNALMNAANANNFRNFKIIAG